MEAPDEMVGGFFTKGEQHFSVGEYEYCAPDEHDGAAVCGIRIQRKGDLEDIIWLMTPDVAESLVERIQAVLGEME